MKTVSTFCIFIMVLHLSSISVFAEIRCYCNLPSCVSTGYMCKSAAGVCFSELQSSRTGHGNDRKIHHNHHSHHKTHRRHYSGSVDYTQTRHGCVESLKSHHKAARCRRSSKLSNDSQVNRPIKTIDNWTIACCHNDMCNYVDSLDIKIQVSTKSNSNYSSEDYEVHFNKPKNFNLPNDSETMQQDLWFKAAVIAVPIAGGFILVLLILLAVKMLRKDTTHQKQILPLRNRQRFLNSNCDQHYLRKNQLDLNCKNPKNNQSNLFKNINIVTQENDFPSNNVKAAIIKDSESDNLLLESMTAWAYFDPKCHR